MSFSKLVSLSIVVSYYITCTVQGFVIRPSTTTTIATTTGSSSSTFLSHRPSSNNHRNHHCNHRHKDHHHYYFKYHLQTTRLFSQSSSSSVQKSNEDETSSKNDVKIQNQQQQQQASEEDLVITTSTLSSSTSTSTAAAAESTSQTTSSSTSTSTTASNTQDDLYEEARKLRLKAKELLEEASIEEQKLLSSKIEQQNTLNTFLDDIIQELIDLKDEFHDQSTVSMDAEAIASASAGTTTTTSNEVKDENTFINTVVVDALKEKKLTTMKLIHLIERLHEREMDAKRIFMDYTSSSSAATVATTTTSNNENKSFNIGDMSNSKEYNESELINLQGWINYIIEAQKIIENSTSNSSNTPRVPSGSSSPSTRMISKMKELKKDEEKLYQRQLANKMNGEGILNNNNSNGLDLPVQDFMKKTLGEEDGVNNGGQNVTVKVDGIEITGSKFNITNLLADIVQIPLWVPSSLLPYVIVWQKELELEDLKKIKTDVLSGSQFHCTSWDSVRFAAVYRGNLMEKNRASSVNALSGAMNPSFSSTVPAGNDTATDIVGFTDKFSYDEESLSSVVFHDIQQRLEKAGLAEKIQLFILEDPEWRPGQDSRYSEPQPVILAVSSAVVPDQGLNRGLAARFLAALSIIATLFTTLAYAISAFALNPNFYNGVVNESDLSIILACLPIFVGIFGLSAFHEGVHLLVAKRRGVKLGLPVPLPSLQIGTFGNITPLRSFPQSRSALFDIALSGPIITSLVSTLMIIGGILLTINTPVDSISTLPVVPAVLVKMSFLVGSITSVLAPKVMMLPLSQPIPIHPLFMIGFTGLVGSALNMLPIGKLDGGRACNAVLGRRPAYLISLISLLFMAISALTGFSTISIFWGLIITLFQRNADVPVRDDLTNVNDFRMGVYIFSIILTVLILAPFPGVPGAL